MSTRRYVTVEDAGPMHARVIIRETNTAPGAPAALTVGEAVIDADEVWTLISHLLNVVRPQALIRDARVGDCSVCQNTRLVVIPNAQGRPESVTCLACGPRLSAARAAGALSPYYQVPTEETTP